MSLHIKRVYEPAETADGQRILVDRIWPRGLTKEKAAVDTWVKTVAPTTELRKWFNHDPARWAEFRARYARELDANPEAVKQLRDLVKTGKTTLLFAAHDPVHNNAVAITEYLDGKLP